LSARSLTDNVVKLFRKRGYAVKQKALFEGLSGLVYVFDLLITKDEEKRIVSIKNYAKTVGVNEVIKLDRAAADVNTSNPIVIGNKFSDHAKAYSRRRGVTIMTSEEVLTLLEEPQALREP